MAEVLLGRGLLVLAILVAKDVKIQGVGILLLLGKTQDYSRAACCLAWEAGGGF